MSTDCFTVSSLCVEMLVISSLGRLMLTSASRTVSLPSLLRPPRISARFFLALVKAIT